MQHFIFLIKANKKFRNFKCAFGYGHILDVYIRTPWNKVINFHVPLQNIVEFEAELFWYFSYEMNFGTLRMEGYNVAENTRWISNTVDKLCVKMQIFSSR